MKIFVPFDRRTGDVYLNAIGSTEDKALKPFVDGCFESIRHDELDFIGCVEAELITGRYIPSDLFPVSLPFSKETGKPELSGIGSNADEARVNLSYVGLDEEVYLFETVAIRMPPLQIEHLPSPIKA